jgi:DNA-binding MarR family transcriptional regulator
LVRAGLVDRRPSPRTRREIELEVSPDGRATLDRYDDLRLVDLRACLGQIADRDDALAVFEAFADPSARPTAPEAAVR